MILSRLALRVIKNSPGIKLKLANALGCSESSISRYITQNHDNLTKAAALKVIRKITGLSNSEILEESPTCCKAVNTNMIEIIAPQHIPITIKRK